MSNRLELIASFVSDGVGVCDVGTDHAYLPALIAKRGYSGNIIATDINEGPILKARRNLQAEGLSEIVKLYMCDGLDAVSPCDIDTIIIAGMGGDTMTGILDRAEWCQEKCKRLILQPATKPEILRFWLINNGFIIASERQILENDTLYQVIVAEPGTDRRYLDSELYTGKFELICESEYFDELLTTHIKRFDSAKRSLAEAKREGLDSWAAMIAVMSDELKRMMEIKYENG